MRHVRSLNSNVTHTTPLSAKSARIPTHLGKHHRNGHTFE